MSWKMTAKELLERYAAGERDFTGVDLYGVDLSNAVLTEINLDRADLKSPAVKLLEQAIAERLPERNPIDILKNVDY